MGVIKRQGIKQSLVNIIGVGIGAISMLTIYPNEKEAYGLARFLLGTSLFFAPFISLGFNAVTIRFFPEFKEENKHNHGFLGMLLLTVTLGSLLLLILTWLFRDNIYDLYSEKSPLFRQFLPYLLPLAICLSFFQILMDYCINYQRIVFPAIFQNLIKITLPVLIVLLTFGLISYQGMANGVLFHYIFVLLAMVGYLMYLGAWHWRPDFSFLTKERRKRLWNFAGFGLLSGVGSVLAIRIDEIMIPSLMDFKSNGIFAIAAFIGNTIIIPSTALTQISSPFIAQYMNENRIAEVGVIYQKASINLTLIGLFFFVGIIVSVEDLFSIMPKSEELQGGFMVVLLIGLARVVDMATSVNNQIINFSHHYRFGMYAILVMGGLNISFNFFFIPRFGIAGAALATFCSILIYNLVKMAFIYSRFGIQPFSWKTLMLFLWAAITYGIAWLYPGLGNPWVDMLVRSLIVAAVYLPVVLYWRISEDINDLLKETLRKVKSFF